MKIPHTELPKKYKIHKYTDSSLVEIPNDIGLIIEMQYSLMGMKEAINKCLVRKEVLDMLIDAKKYLPSDLTFKILDAYRPIKLQEELYYKYKSKIIKEFNLENLSKEEQNKVICNYVSLPSYNEDLVPLHSTGGAIDVTLVRISDGKELDLGVPFDSFSSLALVDAYEKEGMDKVVRNNRRILYNAMIKAGFTNLPSEYWHYEYGNRNWAYYKNKPIIYKGILSID